MERQGIGLRIVAGLIDGIIVGVINFICSLAIIGTMGVSYLSVVIATLAALVVAGAYTSLEFLKAQTPGKMAFGMKIRRQDGSPASQDQLIKRWLFKFSPSILGVLFAVLNMGGMANTVQGLLGLLVLISALMCARESKLALHDEWFGTAVFKGEGQTAGFEVMPPPPPAG